MSVNRHVCHEGVCHGWTADRLRVLYTLSAYAIMHIEPTDELSFISMCISG